MFNILRIVKREKHNRKLFMEAILSNMNTGPISLSIKNNLFVLMQLSCLETMA